MPEEKRKLTIQLSGIESEGGNVHLSEFLSELGAINKTLRKIDQSVSKKSSLRFRITDLRHKSPATVQIEAIPKKSKYDFSEAVINKFLTGIESIQKQKPLSEFDLDMLNTFGQIGGSFSHKPKRFMKKIEIQGNGKSIDLREPLAVSVNKFLGEDEEYSGFVSGMLEALNIHGENKQFTIYPVAGATKINCIFPSDLIKEAIKAIDKYLRLNGTVKYKQKARFPHEISVKEMEVYPDENELPELIDLQGMAPGATGGLDSVEFIRRIRQDE